METEHTLTDEAIAVRIREGNKELFGTLVDRYQEKLLRYARRLLLKNGGSEDAVQNAFINVYVHLKSFDADRSFSSWIYRIVHNECMNEIKKKKGKQFFAIFDFDTLFPHITSKETADGDFQKKELKRLIDSCLDSLTPKYREALILYYYEEMDYVAIADILKIPVSTVGVRLKRGKDLMKKIAQKML